VVKESALVEEKTLSLGTDIATYPSAHQEIEQPFSTRLEDKDLGDVNFPLTDYTDNLGDCETMVSTILNWTTWTSLGTQLPAQKSKSLKLSY
jgi:hypothetical protein